MSSEMLSMRTLGCFAGLACGFTLLAGGITSMIVGNTVVYGTIGYVGVILSLFVLSAAAVLRHDKAGDELRASIDAIKSRLSMLTATSNKMPDITAGQIQRIYSAI